MQNFVITRSGIEGTGVFAARDFKIGEKIYEFPKGKYIEKDRLGEMSEYERDHLDVVDRDTYEIMEPPGVLVNHSCDPNVMEKDRVGYAWKPIRAGDELTVDYRIRAYDDWVLDCKCGSKKCAGKVRGNFFTLSAESQKRYLPYAPKFIQEEYTTRNKKKS